MPPTFPPLIQGTMRTADVYSYVPPSVQGIAAQWYANRNPLWARLRKEYLPTWAFDMKGFRFRPRTGVLTADPATGTTLTLADASNYMNGDVLQLSTGEYVEVTADPNVAANTLTVRRGVGTGPPTPVAATAIPGFATPPAGVVVLVGNSRTGAETLQKAIARTPSTMRQYMQTYQHVVSVGGAVQAINFRSGYSGFIPDNRATPFDSNKMDSLQNIIDDMESSMVIGMGEAPGGSVTRPKAYGLGNILSTNRKVQPTNYANYKFTDFQRDALQSVINNGGNPSVIFASLDFAGGMATWGAPLQRLQAGQTVFGQAINAFASPFIGANTPIIQAPLFPSGTALVLSEDEVAIYYSEALDFKPYGRLGDAYEGDWIARMAVGVQNEAHHAYITGITGFAP